MVFDSSGGAISQSLMAPPGVDDARVFLSGDNAVDARGSRCTSWPSCRPVSTSQTNTVRSSLPEASILPSLENASALLTPGWPAKAARCSPVAVSHSRMESPGECDDVATRVPSADRAAARKLSAGTRIVVRFKQVSTSQIRISGGLWLATVTSDFPSGKNPTTTPAFLIKLRSVPVATSQSLACPPVITPASVRLSGEKAIPQTGPG